MQFVTDIEMEEFEVSIASRDIRLAEGDRRLDDIDSDISRVGCQDFRQRDCISSDTASDLKYVVAPGQADKLAQRGDMNFGDCLERIGPTAGHVQQRDRNIEFVKTVCLRPSIEHLSQSP